MHDGVMRDDLPAEFLLDNFPPGIRETVARSDR
jgi:hypothetical protein